MYENEMKRKKRCKRQAAQRKKKEENKQTLFAGLFYRQVWAKVKSKAISISLL